jgi:hypothetical protein
MPRQYVGPIHSSPKEKRLSNIDDLRIGSDKIALTHVVNSNETILRNRCYVPAEEYNNI